LKRTPEFLELADEIWSLIEEEAGRINVIRRGQGGGIGEEGIGEEGVGG
jgi:NitT/TauT family transport system ATP-binding protein